MMCDQETPCPGHSWSYFCGYNTDGQGKCIACSLVCLLNGSYHESGACGHLCPGFKTYYQSLPKPITVLPILDTTDNLFEEEPEAAQGIFLSVQSLVICGVGLVIVILVLIVLRKRSNIRKIWNKVTSRGLSFCNRTSRLPNPDNIRPPEHTELLENRIGTELEEIVVLNGSQTTVSIHTLPDTSDTVSSNERAHSSDHQDSSSNHVDSPTSTALLDSIATNRIREPHSSSSEQGDSDVIDTSRSRRQNNQQSAVWDKDSKSLENSRLQRDNGPQPNVRSLASEHDEMDSSHGPRSGNDMHSERSANHHCQRQGAKNRSPTHSDSLFHTLVSKDFYTTDDSLPAKGRKASSNIPGANQNNNNGVPHSSRGRSNPQDSDSATKEFEKHFSGHSNEERSLQAQPCPSTTGSPLVTAELRMDSDRDRDVVAPRSTDIPVNDIYPLHNKACNRHDGPRSVDAEQRDESYKSRDAVALPASEVPRNDMYTPSAPQSPESGLVDAEQREQSHTGQDAVALLSTEVRKSDLYPSEDTKKD